MPLIPVLRRFASLRSVWATKKNPISKKRNTQSYWVFGNPEPLPVLSVHMLSLLSGVPFSTLLHGCPCSPVSLGVSPRSLDCYSFDGGMPSIPIAFGFPRFLLRACQSVCWGSFQERDHSTSPYPDVSCTSHLVCGKSSHTLYPNRCRE
jgi:hypothetical protein